MKTKQDIFKLFPDFLLKTLFFASVIKLSSLCKISFVFGSKFTMFSGSCATVPLAGAFAGSFVSFIILMLSFFVRYLIFGVYSLHILAFYLPGLFAALYYSSHFLVKVGTRLILPIICMILFLCNPVGSQAFLYSFFWLIPIAIYFMNKKNIFLDALAATFIAHAVGSVIFLYTVTLSPAIWSALIPIVALERLVIAALVYVLYKVFVYVRQNILNKILKFALYYGNLVRVKFVR